MLMWPQKKKNHNIILKFTINKNKKWPQSCFNVEFLLFYKSSRQTNGRTKKNTVNSIDINNYTLSENLVGPSS